MEIKELVASFNAKSEELKSTNAKVETELKELGSVSVETKSALEKQETALTEMKSQFNQMNDALKDVQAKSARMDSGEPIEMKSVGGLFVESDVYKSMSDSERGNGQPFVVEKKDITNLAASAGSLVQIDRQPRVYMEPNRPMRIRDLIPHVPTASNAIEYMRENVFTNNAGMQGTVAGIGSGEMVTKNQSEITWELISKPIRTVAHWIAASRQVLSDAPMLRGLIDNRLSYGLDLKSDQQLLQGDGTGQNLEGILVDSDINDIGEMDNSVGADPSDIAAAMIEHIRTAITTEQVAEYYNMNGLVLNPADWQKIETAKATDGHYLMVSMPTGRATETVWKIPVVVTNAMPVNTFLIGDWTLGAVIYDRESVSIRVSESHASYFVQNGVAVLAEERYTLGIPLPKAFCKGSFVVADA